MKHEQPQHFGMPQQAGPAAPSAPKKSNTGKIIGFSCLGVVAAFAVIGGCSAVLLSGSDGGDMQQTDPPAAAAAGGAEQDAKQQGGGETAEKKKEKTQAEVFKACVAENGTPPEKEAVQHVTKVTGTEERNDILDSADVFTDYTGGIMGPHTGDAKLIASAFTSCYDSDNGLVTVYGADGEILSNGNF